MVWWRHHLALKGVKHSGCGVEIQSIAFGKWIQENKWLYSKALKM